MQRMLSACALCLSTGRLYEVSGQLVSGINQKFRKVRFFFFFYLNFYLGTP